MQYAWRKPTHLKGILKDDKQERGHGGHVFLHFEVYVHLHLQRYDSNHHNPIEGEQHGTVLLRHVSIFYQSPEHLQTEFSYEKKGVSVVKSREKNVLFE